MIRIDRRRASKADHVSRDETLCNAIVRQGCSGCHIEISKLLRYGDYKKDRRFDIFVVGRSAFSSFKLLPSNWTSETR